LLCCLLFLPGLALGLAVGFAPAWAALCLAGLLLAFGGTQSTRVPLYLSSTAAIAELGRLVCAHRPRRVLDLGCGTARVLSALSRSHPEVVLEGVERAPLPFLVASARSFLQRTRFGIRWQNLWTVDLSAYDMVYAYLSPAPMPRLWDKAIREMRRGSLLISFQFCVPDVPPDQIVEAGGKKLFVWRMP
jgi:SAM-dependent methyltransferase